MASSIGTGVFGGSGGFGGMFTKDPGKKFTADDCLAAIIADVTANPGRVREQVQVFTDRDAIHLDKMMDLLSNAGNWNRIATKRGSSALEGEENPTSGSDREVRIFVNEAWEDYDHDIEVHVITEFGEMLPLVYKINY